MKKLISSLLLTCSLFLGVGFVNVSLAAQKSIIVGANLSDYKKPTKKQCNVDVPSQYATIQAAIDAASPGNTVCVKAGIYNEDIWVTKSVRLLGNGFDYPSVINGQSSLLAPIIVRADNVAIEGFVINGVAPDSSPGVTNVPAVLLWQSSSSTTIRYNKITSGNKGLAIRSDGGQNNLIQDNIIEGNNSPTVVLIGFNSNKVDFLDNTFIGTVDTLLENTGFVLVEHATNSLIERNLFNTSGQALALISYDYGSGSGAINYNNFNSSAAYKVAVSVGLLNAENNWWGDLDPSDNILHDVDFEPFAIKPYKQY